MATPFAALESRVNSAALRHASNAACSALNAQGQLQAFEGLFDAASTPQFGGMVADLAPQVQCKTSDVAALAWAGGITVSGTAYTVANISHDGTGWTTLTLREA